MSKWKSILKCVGFIAGLAVILCVCDYLFAQTGYINFILREVNDSKQNYDTIVLGASHTRAAIDPEYIDEELGTNTLNLGIPSETVKDSYYVLEEACRKNKVKRVILDVDYQYWVNPQGDGYFREPFIYNQMSWTSPVKWQYLFENMDAMDVRNAFSNRITYLCTWKNMKSNIEFKNSDTYKNHDIYGIDVPDADGPYVGKGFFYRGVDGRQPAGYDYLKLWYGREKLGVSKYVEKHFKKLKNYCDKNNIELIAVTSPITPSAMQLLNIQDAEKSLREEIFDKYGITYYDFNQARMDVIPREDADYGDMEGHMGGRIGQEYSKVLAKVLRDHVDGDLDYNKYFYSSYEDMYKNMDQDYTNAKNALEGKDE